MPRLIDANKLRKGVLDLPNCYNGFSDSYDKAMIIDLIDEQPTIDVDSLNAKHENIGYEKGYRDGYAEALEVTDNAEPVRHGRWIKQDGHYYCSSCNAQNFYAYLYNSDTREYEQQDNYCPHCGAKMDGERREDETN